MKKALFLVLALFIASTLVAQRQGDGGMPYFPLAQDMIVQVVFPKPDIQRLRKEDALNDKKGGGPWRFGWNHDTQLTLDNAGSWISLDNGGKIWLLKIHCVDAQTVNLTFQNTTIPQGNRLFVYDDNYASTLGKFTQKHLYQGWLGTELITGSTAVIEYYVAPENIHNIGSLTVATVTHGYRLWDEFQQKAFGNASYCNKNVNCPEAATYAQQKKSVVMIVSGSNGICTGTLINNTAYNGKPYVLTANHCYSGSHPSWLFRFNWEAPDCENPSSSPAYSSLSGAQLKARRTKSDFLLLEITGGLENGTVPASFSPYFAGWDRTGVVPLHTVCMHHPKGDIKKISFDDQSPEITQSNISGVLSGQQDVWKVIWDRNTTTESASSGSPLFDHNKRLIGQLWGGQAQCSNSGEGADFFGRFFSSWDPEGSDPTNQLKHWLDPENTQALMVDGYDNQTIASNDVALINLENPLNALCGTDISPQFSVVNLGTTNVTSISIAYGWDGQEHLTYSWTGNLSFLQSETLTLPTETLSSGSHSFVVAIAQVNGQLDDNTHNDTLSSQFYLITNPTTVTLNISFDMYAYETSWKITTSDAVVVHTNPPYFEEDAGKTRVHSFCLSSDSCYTLTVYDSGGDGMIFTDNMGNPIDSIGHFQLIFFDQDSLLAEMKKEEASFGDSLVRSFCLGTKKDNPPPIPPDPPDPPQEKPAVSLIDWENAWVEVFPNPSNGTIYWSPNTVTTVTLFDMNGNKLIQQTESIKTNALHLQQLTDAVYWLEMELIDGSKVHRKIVLIK